jgi:hypothetical protein
VTLQQRFATLAKDKFLGVPIQAFEAAGREKLNYLLKAGLRTSSGLVDDYLAGWFGNRHELSPATRGGTSAAVVM